MTFVIAKVQLMISALVLGKVKNKRAVGVILVTQQLTGQSEKGLFYSIELPRPDCIIIKE
jgi:hypothetical protein